MKNRQRQELELQLLARLQSAEKRYRSAAEECNAAAGQFRDMMSHPDGAAGLHNAARNERVAVQQYHAALKDFTDLVVYGRPPQSLPQEPAASVEVLTSREIEVLKLIAEGLTTKKIAQQLGVSFKTVVAHKSHIMNKLDIHSSVLLTRYAIRRKLIEP
jgi:DNA-binding NarL/FixJ family response regulator